jgi:hypothetical protein
MAAPSAGSRIVTILCAIGFLGSATALVRVVAEQLDPEASRAQPSSEATDSERAPRAEHQAKVREVAGHEGGARARTAPAAASAEAAQASRILRWQREQRVEREARAAKQRAETLAAERAASEAERDAWRKELIASWLRERAARLERRDASIIAERELAQSPPALLTLRGREKVAAGDAWREGDLAQTRHASSVELGWVQRTRPGGAPPPLPGPSVASPVAGRAMLLPM